MGFITITSSSTFVYLIPTWSWTGNYTPIVYLKSKPASYMKDDSYWAFLAVQKQ